MARPGPVGRLKALRAYSLSGKDEWDEHSIDEPLPKLANRRTSLADFYHVYKSCFCIASVPEWGRDRTGTFDPEKQGRENFSAPVMSIIEELGTFFDQPKEQGYRPISVNNLVDFKDSANSKFCDTRIRWNEKGKPPVFCNKDMDRDLEGAVPDEDWDEGKGKFRVAVENSCWFVYWNGKVAGGLTASFGEQPDVVFPEIEDDMWDYVFGGKNEVRNDGTESDEFYLKMLNAHGPTFVRSTFRTSQRTVVMISVDGGAVSQVEKMRLPELAKSVLSDLRRRKYEWAGSCALFWAHFETIEDMLHSFAGVRNLAVDLDEAHFLMTDHLAIPSTYRSVQAEQRPCCASLLLCTPQDILSRAGGTTVTHSNFVAAVLNDDPDTAEYILRRVDDPAEFLSRPVTNGISNYSPIIAATRYARRRSVAMLVEHFARLGMSLDGRVRAVDERRDVWEDYSAIGVAVAAACRAWGPIWNYGDIIRDLVKQGLHIEGAMGESQRCDDFLRDAIAALESKGFKEEKSISRRNREDHDTLLAQLRTLLTVLGEIVEPSS